MDEFVDQLLTEERVCDTILPRLSSREVLEDQDQLEPRQSVLQGDLEPSDSDESDSSIDSRAQYSDRSLPQSPVQSDDEMIPAAKGGRLKLKKPPVEKQKSEGTSSPTTNGGFKEEMSFEETNKLRISLGLKPLQRC
jgi:pre-mRNA-splicing factor 38A